MAAIIALAHDVLILLAFYGTVPNILQMILSQYLIKVIYAALDTIPFYLLTRSTVKEATA